MYEDPTVEASVFPPGGRVFCIASAGCTARVLAERHEVVAVDLNPVQLDYARRRLAGAPAQVGTAERVMGWLRRLLPLAGVTRSALEDFLALDRPAEQSERWRRLETRRFRLGVESLLSLTGLRAVYASPFLRDLPRRFGRVLLARLARGFATHPNRTNPYARALLLGDLDARASEPPPAGRVELVCADAAAYLEAQLPGSFSGFTLSNIVDGAAPAYRERLFAAVRRASTTEGLMVWRSFGEPPASPTAPNLADRDRALIWGIVQVERAHPPVH
jgi:hypothetical protein